MSQSFEIIVTGSSLIQNWRVSKKIKNKIHFQQGCSKNVQILTKRGIKIYTKCPNLCESYAESSRRYQQVKNLVQFMLELFALYWVFSRILYLFSSQSIQCRLKRIWEKSAALCWNYLHCTDYEAEFCTF